MSVSSAEELGRIYEAMVSISELRRRVAYCYRSKPILGVSFAPIGLHLASMVDVDKGLDSVSFMVIHPETRFIVSVGPTKAVALSMGRRFVEVLGTARVREWCHAYQTWRDDKLKEFQARNKAEFEQRRASTPPKARISRRRREIFDKSDGKCHYCATTLTLDGTWHIEHKLPRALGGDNHPENLTASCAPCNFKKRDRTDTEFLALGAAA